MPDYGSRSDMKKLINHVIDSGVTFLDASGVYSPQINEHLMGDASITQHQEFTRYPYLRRINHRD
ncbi:hypothetical protein LguiB_012939 [Lonicera macranthoides]